MTATVTGAVPVVMDEKIAAILRAPFPPESVGKLPRIWCGKCRTAQERLCDKHRKVRCSGCNNNITEAHLHLDYVGHAEITDRLLQADRLWMWEPVAWAANGLPLIDDFGGMWIRLTVAGVTRLGYGHAEGKKGPDAIKETIGDALRNAAMRFGVALDLWGATFKESSGDESHHTEHAPAVEVRPEPQRNQSQADDRTPDQKAAAIRDWVLKIQRDAVELERVRNRLLNQQPEVAAARITNEHGDDEQLSVFLTRHAKEARGDQVDQPVADVADQGQHNHMHALWSELGYGGDANRTIRLDITAGIVGRPLDTSKSLTHAEADAVIQKLTDRKSRQAGANA